MVSMPIIESFTLDLLEVSHFQVKPVLRCLLHTILFHRTLGMIEPIENDCEIFDISYIQGNDPIVIKDVEERIEAFSHSLWESESKKGKIFLSFYQPKYSQSWFFKTKVVEKLYWEKWIIPISINTISSSRQRKLPLTDPSFDNVSQIEKNVRDRMFTIVQLVNEKKEHIPPIKTEDVVCFPYEITFPALDSSWSLGAFKRMLVTGPPLLLNN